MRVILTWRSCRAVQQRGGQFELQRQLGEVGQSVRKMKVVGRDGAAGRPKDLDHPAMPGNLRLGRSFDQADVRLVATKLAREFRLGQPLLDPPFRQPHDNRSIEPDCCRYGAPSYLVNGLHTFDNVENDTMSYSVLVMRPGNRLREMRKKAGLNQAELAEASGMTQTAISNYENGHRPLSLHNMRVFARLLKCTVADLLDPSDNPFMLDDDERKLVTDYRSADDMQREMVKRVAEPASTYRQATKRDAA